MASILSFSMNCLARDAVKECELMSCDVSYHDVFIFEVIFSFDLYAKVVYQHHTLCRAGVGRRGMR